MPLKPWKVSNRQRGLSEYALSEQMRPPDLPEAPVGCGLRHFWEQYSNNDLSGLGTPAIPTNQGISDNTSEFSFNSGACMSGIQMSIAVSLGRMGEDPFLLLLTVLAAGLPGLVAVSFSATSSHGFPLSCFCLICLSLTKTPVSPLMTQPDIPGQAPHLKILSWITPSAIESDTHRFGDSDVGSLGFPSFSPLSMESLEPWFPSWLPLGADFDVETGSSKKISLHAACDKTMYNKEVWFFKITNRWWKTSMLSRYQLQICFTSF